MLLTLLFKRWMAALGRRLWHEGGHMEPAPDPTPDPAPAPTDSSPTVSSPTVSSATPAGSADPMSAKRVAREGLLLYHNLNKLDRWGGGGFALSTLVKLAGWAGLLAVLGALVVKLRTVEQQLDPVSHGVDELELELEHSRDQLAAQTKRNQAQLESARKEAEALRDAVRATSEAHAAAGAALTDADRTTRALADRLATELDKSKQLEARQETAAHSVSGFAEQVTAAQTQLTTAQTQMTAAQGQLASSQSAAQASWTGLGTDLQAVRAQAQALGQGVAGVDLKPMQADLAQVDAQAKALSAALTKATQDTASLDQAVQARLQQEQERTAALRAQAQAEKVQAEKHAGALGSSKLPGPTPVVASAGTLASPSGATAH